MAQENFYIGANWDRLQEEVVTEVAAPTFMVDGQEDTVLISQT